MLITPPAPIDDEPPEPPEPLPTRRSSRRWAPFLVAALAAGALAGAVTGGLTERPSTPATGGSCPVAAAPPSALPAVIESVVASVVAIDVSSTTFDVDGIPVLGQMSGSGFVIDANGLVATNAHVVEGGGRIAVTLPGGEVVDGTLVGIDDELDLAVVDAHTGGLTPARFGCSADLRVGDTVVAVGNALGLGGEPTASTGIVAALDRSITTQSGRAYTGLIQTDMAVNEGQSGGPLVDATGQVVGVTSAGLAGGSNVGFAIGIDEALPALLALQHPLHAT